MNAGLAAVSVVTGSGSDAGRPDGPKRTFQRFIAPPRSLPKKRCLPSADQTGFQSRDSSWVTGTRSPPDDEMVRMSRWPVPGGTDQNAIRRPSGDHEGWTPSASWSFRVLPEATSTSHREL